MDGKQGKTEVGEERKAVRELICISFETMQQDESIPPDKASMAIDGWISSRRIDSRVPPIQPLPRKARYSRRHNRCFSARRTPSLPSESSSKTLDPPSERLEMTTVITEEQQTAREPRVVQPFGSSSGNVPLARDLLKQFPPRRPRRDMRISAYAAYSLVKQATEMKLASERQFSQPNRTKESLKPPRPEAIRKEKPCNLPIEITPTHREDKENTASKGSSERMTAVRTERVFTENVKRFLRTSAEEQAAQRQQHTRRLNTALTLAKFSL